MGGKKRWERRVDDPGRVSDTVVRPREENPPFGERIERRRDARGVKGETRAFTVVELRLCVLARSCPRTRHCETLCHFCAEVYARWRRSLSIGRRGNRKRGECTDRAPTQPAADWSMPGFQQSTHPLPSTNRRLPSRALASSILPAKTTLKPFPRPAIWGRSFRNRKMLHNQRTVEMCLYELHLFQRNFS